MGGDQRVNHKFPNFANVVTQMAKIDPMVLIFATFPYYEYAIYMSEANIADFESLCHLDIVQFLVKILLFWFRARPTNIGMFLVNLQWCHRQLD